MSRAHSSRLPLPVYALATIVVGLIAYILMLLLSGSETVQARAHGQPIKARSTGFAQNTQSVQQLEEVGYLQSAANKEAAVQNTESATERSTRLIKESLGVKTQKASEAAVIVELLVSESCSTKEDEQTSLPILYRFDSPTIRTSSIYQLRSLVSQYRRCENSNFLMTSHTPNRAESKIELAQMRFDELKYFFTQNSVPKSALHYSKIP